MGFRIIKNLSHSSYIPYPKLLTPVLYLLLFCCFYLNYVSVAAFFHKIASFENLEEITITVQVNQVSYFDFTSLVIFVETGFLMVLMFFLGYLNFSNEPRIKTSFVSVFIVLCFLGWEVYAYFNGVKNIPMIVFLALMLSSMCYVIISMMRPQEFINFFQKSKDSIYYEYTYQKLFLKPSILWAQKFKVKPDKRKKIVFKKYEKMSHKEKVDFGNPSLLGFKF